MALHEVDFSAAVQTHLGPLVGDEPGTGDVPGIAYGIVRRGELVHAGGLGVTSLDPGKAVTPSPSTAFRIASMTKSFTAAALLALRDDGLLAFDASVASLIPEFDRAGWNREVTVRQLMTMSAGFPTDDPWGDRQQALDPAAFRAFIAAGLAPSWRPGECFEYSNLGYAMLGLVIEQATGQRYRDVVRERVLGPLGLTSTGYDASEIGGAPLADGYVRRTDVWVVEPVAGYGAFAPMGGLYSTVNDLARWVAELSMTNKPSLLEMQTGQRFIDAVTPNAATDANPTTRAPEVHQYGFGLFEELLSYGRSVMHSGGYPGYGSHMRWHPSSGWGVVALGNRTYAPMGKFAARILADLVVADGVADRTTAPSYWKTGRLAEAVAVAESLTDEWDDNLADRWFADNMELDSPREIRRETLATLKQVTGGLSRSSEVEPRSPSPTEASWWLAGTEGARVRVDLLLSPHPVPKIQLLNWTRVDRAAQAGAQQDGPTTWPPVEPARTQINPRHVSTNI